MALNLPCDWKAGFVIDPVKKSRFGYLTDFAGIGLANPLTPDITVYCAYNNTTAPGYGGLTLTAGSTAGAAPTAKVVGIVENISWDGSVGGPFSFSVYMSSENANQLKALKQMTLKTTSITQIGWYVGNYDEVSKVWFDEHYPKAPVKPTGQINAVNKSDVRLHIADEGVRFSPNIDALVYNVYFEMVCAANQLASFLVATSPTKNMIMPWGFVIGTLPTTAVPVGT